jgi:hypothetical protein
VSTITELVDAYRDAVAKYWHGVPGDPPEPRTIPTAAEARTALLAAVAELEKDAERYRWLRARTRRDVGFTLSDLGASIAVRNFPPGYLTLDAAIDAARQVTDPKESGQ